MRAAVTKPSSTGRHVTFGPGSRLQHLLTQPNPVKPFIHVEDLGLVFHTVPIQEQDDRWPSGLHAARYHPHTFPLLGRGLVSWEHHCTVSDFDDDL
jgi:hypothetical protein